MARRPSAEERGTLLKQALKERNTPTLNQKNGLLQKAISQNTLTGNPTASRVSNGTSASLAGFMPPPSSSSSKTTTKQTKASRSNSPSDTIFSGKVKYLGSKSCDGQLTEENLQKSVKFFKNTKAKTKDVKCFVETFSIKLVDMKGSEIQTCRLNEIACYNIYKKDSKHFYLAYMSNVGDKRVAVAQCHVLICKGKDVIAAMNLAIGAIAPTADYGTETNNRGETVPVAPRRSSFVGQDAIQEEKDDFEVPAPDWVFKCDVNYLGQGKRQKSGGPAESAEVIKKLNEMMKLKRKSSKNKLDTNASQTTTPMNDLDLTIAGGLRSVRLFDRASSEKVDQILYSDIKDVHCVDGKNPYVCIITSKFKSRVFTYYILTVPYVHGSSIYKMLKEFAATAQIETTAEKLQASTPFDAIATKREPVPGQLHNMQIHRADLKAERILGSGQFGEVYLAIQVTPNKREIKRAVKMLKNGATPDAKTEFVQECNMMVLAGKHPNIVQMVGVALQQPPWLCVLEFLPYGDLQGLVSDLAAESKVLELGVVLKLSEQLINGCAHLASKRIVHMDLAARNVLVGPNNLLKIADLGLAHEMVVDGEYYILPERIPLALKWMSPESMENLFFSEYSDVWAIGVTIWEIFSYGEMPLKTLKNSDVLNALKGGLRPRMPNNCPQAFWNLLSKCWMHKMNERPKFAELGEKLKPFLKKYPPTDPLQKDIGVLLQLPVQTMSQPIYD